MTSPVTGAETRPLPASTSAAATAKVEYMLDASAAADCRARCAAVLSCHPLSQATEL